MHCIKCGAALPPEAATCPACGAATPYNVTTSTPEIADTRIDSAAIDNTGEEKALPISQIGETPPMERTVLQQLPQPESLQSQSVLERTVLQEPPQLETPAPQVERTVLQQPLQADQPGQQHGLPQPALPASSPAWQQLQPKQAQPTPQPGAAQAQQIQPWPQPFPGQQPPQQGPWQLQPGSSQPLPWPQQRQHPIGPQSYPAWQQPQQAWPEPFPGQPPLQQGPWQPRPGTPQSMPGPQQPQPGVPQSYPAWQRPQPGAVQSWPQPRVGQPQMQSSPAWQQPQVGMAQPLPGQQAHQRRGLSLAMILLLVTIVLVIISTSGLTYYTVAVLPANLHAQATSVAQDFLTVQARSMLPESIYTQATSGRPVINDPLSSPNNSSWQNDFGCTFTAGAYHVIVQQANRPNTCLAKGTFNNFAFQIQMTIINGVVGGLIFRGSNALEHYYFFSLNTGGVYSLYLVEEGFTQLRGLNSNSSPAIKTGLNQPNLLTVVARGSNIYLYINKQFVASVHDGTYSSGTIGLEATTTSANPSADVAFSNAQVWTL